MTLPKITHLRELLATTLLDIDAARVKGTPRRFMGRIWNGTRDRIESLTFS